MRCEIKTEYELPMCLDDVCTPMELKFPSDFILKDIEINANNRLIAKGEVIVIEDRLGVTITNTIKMTE